MHYRYIKNTRSNKVKRKILFPKLTFPKYLPLVFIFTGGIIILNVVFPIASYQFILSPRLAALLSPEAQTQVLAKTTQIEDQAQSLNWFNNMPKLPPLPSRITHYTISIPKLKIIDALVTIGGENLDESLIHYQGTALPGQLGNAVIFGHSALPQFWGPKNYLGIFSNLPTMKIGDEVFVGFDGILYKFIIEEISEVVPEDISIMEQNYRNSYLTLVTCVPPGTIYRRLIIKAKIEKI